MGGGWGGGPLCAFNTDPTAGAANWNRMHSDVAGDLGDTAKLSVGEVGACRGQGREGGSEEGEGQVSWATC